MFVARIFDSVREILLAGSRTVARKPILGSLLVLLLALGSGALTTLLALSADLFWRAPPAIEEPRLLVRAVRFSKTVASNAWSYPDFADFAEQVVYMEGLAAYTSSTYPMTFSAGSERQVIEVGYVSANFFRVAGIRLDDGDSSQFERASAMQSEGVIVSHAFKRRVFGESGSARGREVVVNGVSCTVAGVAPATFRALGPADATPDLWVPIALFPRLSPAAGNRLKRTAHGGAVWLDAIGRLPAGGSMATGQSDLDRIAGAMAAEIPSWAEGGEGARLVEDFRFEPSVGARLRKIVRMLGLVAAVVLLIVAINVGLLMAVRLASRSQELEVRLSLGIPPWWLVCQLLCEALMLGVLGGAGGVLLAWGATLLAVRLLPYELALSQAPSLASILATVGFAGFVAMAVGCISAARALRLGPGLLVSRRLEAGPGWKVQDLLVVAQVALAVSLAAVASLFALSLREASDIKLGFVYDGRLLVSFDLGPHGYDIERSEQLMARALESLDGLAGVNRAAASLMVPFRGMIRIDLPVNSEAGETVPAALEFVSSGYFATLGIPLLRGRDFSASDSEGGTSVVAINQTAEALLFPDGALGNTVTAWGGPSTIVGVVGDTRFNDLEETVLPRIFVPKVVSMGPRFSLIVDTNGRPGEVAATVEKMVRDLDPNLPLRGVERLDSLVGKVLRPFRTGASLSGVLAALALLLSALGVYGVLSHRVLQRRQIIGVQMALGASAGRIVGAVLFQGIALGAFGLVIGLVLAWASERAIEGFLFSVEARDLRAFAAAAILLFAVIVIASWLPARRASRVDPSVIIKQSST